MSWAMELLSIGHYGLAGEVRPRVPPQIIFTAPDSLRGLNNPLYNGPQRVPKIKSRHGSQDVRTLQGLTSRTRGTRCRRRSRVVFGSSEAPLLGRVPRSAFLSRAGGFVEA